MHFTEGKNIEKTDWGEIKSFVLATLSLSCFFHIQVRTKKIEMSLKYWKENQS